MSIRFFVVGLFFWPGGGRGAFSTNRSFRCSGYSISEKNISFLYKSMHQGKHRIFSINDESDVKKIIKLICDCWSTNCNTLTLKVTWCSMRTVQKKTYIYCHWLSEYIISLDYMNIEGDRLWNWPFSHISDLCELDPDLWSGNIAYHCKHSSTSIYIPHFIDMVISEKLWMDGRRDVRTYRHWDRLC